MRPTQLVLQVPDMHCEGCARTIQERLSRLEDVSNVTVDPRTKKVVVEWWGSAKTGERLTEVMASAGFRVQRTEFLDGNGHGPACECSKS